MQMLIEMISSALIPLLLIAALFYGLIRRVDVYDAFLEGAAEGLPVIVQVLPYLAGMLMAIRVFRESGLMNLFTNLLAPLLSPLGVDTNLVPLIFLRPLSGSGSMALVKELMDRFGPDSLPAYTAAILMGSSETIFYEASLYFGSVGVKKMGFTLPGSRIASVAGVVAGILAARLTW